MLDTLCDRLGLFHFPILDANLLAQLGCGQPQQHGTAERSSLVGELHLPVHPIC